MSPIPRPSSCSGGVLGDCLRCTGFLGLYCVTILCCNFSTKFREHYVNFHYAGVTNLMEEKCYYFQQFRRLSASSEVFCNSATHFRTPCTHKTIPSFGHEHFWLTLPVRQRCEDEQFLVDEPRVAFLLFCLCFLLVKIILFKELPHGTAFFLGASRGTAKVVMVAKARFVVSKFLTFCWSDLQAGARATLSIMALALGTAARAWWWEPMVEWWCHLCHSPAYLDGFLVSVIVIFRSCWLSSDQTSIPLSHIKSLSHDASGVVISISAESQFFWPLRFGFKGKGKGKGKSPLKVAMNSAQNQSQMVPLYWIQQKEQGCIDQHLQKHLSLIWVSDFDTGWNHLKGRRVWRKSMDSFIRCQSVLTWTEVGSGKLIASLHFLSHNCDSGSGKEGVDWQHPWGLHFEWKSL